VLQYASAGSASTVSTCVLYFYGANGKRLGTYNCGYAYGQFVVSTANVNVYFGKKLIASGSEMSQNAVITDRLGSVRGQAYSESIAYYPWGEERTSTPNNTDKFATYFRDGYGQDYADQRYYTAVAGRFWSPDPTMDGVDYSNPQSWNGYAYVGGDPINFGDPSGLTDCGDITVQGAGTLSDEALANTDQGHYIDLVWHEAGTLSQAGGNQYTWFAEFDLIAQAIWNRYQIVSGNVSVTGANGTVYSAGLGNVGQLGYLVPGAAPTLNNVLIEAAAGTGVLTGTGQLANNAGLISDLDQDQGDFSYSAASGRTFAVLTASGQTLGYVTSDCASVIEAMWAANSVAAGTIDLNTPTFFPTSWNSSAPINNPNYAAGVENLLGSEGPTNIFGFETWGPPVVRRPPPPRRPTRRHK
jgi:RHS repeat-associated protein